MRMTSCQLALALITAILLAACTNPAAPRSSGDCGGTTVGSDTHC
jgi:hypothetical protein